MSSFIAIALMAFSLFGPGWSSEHKAFWEWQLQHKLEGYQEYRLSRGWRPGGEGPLLQDPSSSDTIELYCTATMGGGIICEDVPPK